MAQCDAAGFKYAAVEYGYQVRVPCMWRIRLAKPTSPSLSPISACAATRSAATRLQSPTAMSLVGLVPIAVVLAVVADSSSDAFAPCAGTANPTVMCGGGGIMSIYQKGVAAAPVSSSVKPTSSSVKPASSSTIVVRPTTTRQTTAVATSSAKVVRRGIDEAGVEFEEEEVLDAGSDQTVFVREVETIYQIVTVTETVEAPATTHIDRKDIPFLHKPAHGHAGNLNHHVGLHM